MSHRGGGYVVKGFPEPHHMWSQQVTNKDRGRDVGGYVVKGFSKPHHMWSQQVTNKDRGREVARGDKGAGYACSQGVPPTTPHVVSTGHHSYHMHLHKEGGGRIRVCHIEVGGM